MLLTCDSTVVAAINEPIGDLSIRGALRNQGQDLQFSPRQEIVRPSAESPSGRDRASGVFGSSIRLLLEATRESRDGHKRRSLAEEAPHVGLDRRLGG
jgi:hypothetical protein